MEDANFDRSVANQAVTYLHNEEEWARLVLADDQQGTVGHIPQLFFITAYFSCTGTYMSSAYLSI